MTIHRYGVVSREQVNALTGKRVLESIIAGQLGGRRWHRRVRGCEHLCNPPGIAHGGRTPTLIDSAAGGRWGGDKIGNFRHKGLRQLFEDDTPKGVNAAHVRKLKQILALLQVAEKVEDLEVPTFRLHALKE